MAKREWRAGLMTERRWRSTLTSQIEMLDEELHRLKEDLQTTGTDLAGNPYQRWTMRSEADRYNLSLDLQVFRTMTLKMLDRAEWIESAIAESVDRTKDQIHKRGKQRRQP